jgi:hypothetical protein
MTKFADAHNFSEVAHKPILCHRHRDGLAGRLGPSAQDASPELLGDRVPFWASA